MVDATVSYAIQKLDDFLTQEIKTRVGVKDGVRWLKDELGYLQSSVRDAEANQDMDNRIFQWINNVGDVANEAVIVIERFSILQTEHEAIKQGVVDCMRSFICICKKEDNLYDIGKEIESVKGRVVEIKNRQQEYGITNILANPKVKQKKRTFLKLTSFENLVDVVGFEDDYKTLLAQLIRGDPSLRVISIHGMGGLGKTTLASKLYHSSELSHFGSRSWVCVSEEYNIKDVLKKMIKSFIGHEMNLLKMDEVDLLHHLRNLLLGHDRSLVVVDDIWDIDVWEKIKKVFPDKNGSRVIITTRNKKVAQRVDNKCFVHELRFLREDESWQLFCKRAEPTQNLEKIGKEIVGKCRGLPLAIVIVSGLLLHRKSYKDWSEVKDNIWRQLTGDSVHIQEVLNLSYDDMSFQMRQCFLYLARFPEDHTLEVYNLKLLWIAEEFISEADEGSGVVMEDVAEDYLNELINRNMIQIARLQVNGQVMECQVHDLVRDLAIQKARETKLLGIFDTSKQHPSPIRLLQGQPRHVIYNNGIRKYLNLLGPNSDNLKLRSLTIIDEIGGRVKIEEIKLMYTRFKYLKVLDMSYAESDGIPEELGNLVLLKFLSLIRGHFISKPLVVPPTIGKLKKLQTLSGSVFSKYELPGEICELKELRHLKFSKPIVIPSTIDKQTKLQARGSLNISGNQTKLQTLGTIWYDDWIQIDTLNLTNLRTLVIANYAIGTYPYTLDSLANLIGLQVLLLKFGTTVIPPITPLSSCKCLKSVLLVGTMKDPSELKFLPESVTELILQGSEFIQDPMPTLGSFKNLTALYLDMGTYIGEKMVCGHDAFPSLQYFKLRYLPNLEEWQIEDGALPSLKGFNIDGCEKLRRVPEQVNSSPPIPDIFSFWIDIGQ